MAMQSGVDDIESGGAVDISAALEQDA